MLVAMTAKEIAGYLKARSAKRRDVLGGITFNDGYNVPNFGITKSAYDAINRAMTDEYGAFGEPTNLTPAVVKKALKNHLERGTRHHATKKSGTWEHVASVSADWYDDAGSVASDLADAVERKFGIERMIEGSYPNFRVFAKGDESTVEKARVYAGQWLANVSEQARGHHATKKKSPAQLQREIDEALAKPANGDAASIANQLTPRDRSTLAWLIENWPWPYRGYADADMARLHGLGLVEATTGDTWGAPTPLGRAVWPHARQTWIDEWDVGAAYKPLKKITGSKARTSKRSHAVKSTKSTKSTKSAEDPMALAHLKARLADARSDYRFWSGQEGELTRDERAQKTQALRRVEQLEAALVAKTGRRY